MRVVTDCSAQSVRGLKVLLQFFEGMGLVNSDDELWLVNIIAILEYLGKICYHLFVRFVGVRLTSKT